MSSETVEQPPTRRPLEPLVLRNSRCVVSLYLADCHDLLPSTDLCDLIVTDPPYGKGYHSGGVSSLPSEKWESPSCDKWKGETIVGDETPDTRVMLLLAERLKEGCAAYVFSQWMTEPDWIEGIEAAGLKVRNRLIWAKPFQGAGDLKTTYGPQHESVIYATKGRHELRGRRDGDVWVERVGRNGCFRQGLLHPCQKPVPLLEWLIDKSSDTGQTVCDPFMGSGSTGVACIRTGRNFIGVEKDERYFEVAADRLRRELEQGRMF